MLESGVENEKIVVVPNPVSMKIKEENRESERNRNYVLFIGRLVSQKGVWTFIKAAEKLPDIAFRIIGFGPLEDSIKNYIAKKSISNIELVGFVPNNKISEHIHSSRFVVIPSEWYDNLPTVLFEALLCGTPLIGSKIGGIPEIINDEIGLLTTPGDVNELHSSIRLLNDNELLRKKLSRNAREYVEKNFSVDEHYRKLFEIYTQYC